MISKFLRATALYLAFTVFIGLGYSLLVTGIGQAVFSSQANGSLIEDEGRVIGSDLLGQPFTSAGYFHPRPSLAGDGYDAASSGASNLGATSAQLVADVTTRAQAAGASDQDPVPVDLVTASGSGLDPHISPASAAYQVARVAEARDMEPDALRALVERHVEGRTLGILGEPRVNVLALNRALDAATGGASQ